jgi:serine protease AprX
MLPRRIIAVIIVLIVLLLLLLSLVLMPFVVPQSNSWAEAVTQINKLHDLGFDGSDVTIGIIDTGVDSGHQEFESSSFVAWNDTIHHETSPYDDEDHGTHLAGLLVSQGSYGGLFSGFHLRGIAQSANLIIVKSIPQNQYLYGGGNDSTIAAGIEFCIDYGADIILLSLGMSPEKVNFSEKNLTLAMIDEAVQKGIFVVVPAGNDGHDDDGDVCFPATLDSVIAVGSLTKTSSVSLFSSKGHQYLMTQHPNKKPELVAPGEEIISTRVSNAYGSLSGTSQAATYVAGILALLLDAYPAFKHDGAKNQNETTLQLFKEIFATTAKKIGSLQHTPNQWSHDDYYGYGLIQAFDAYTELAKY